MTHRSRRHVPSIWLLTVGIAAAAPAVATAAPINGGSLTWSQANVYDTSAPPNTDRTWLGYLARTGPGAPEGSATPTGAASGPVVDSTSPKGPTSIFDTTFPATGGTYDPWTGTGAIEFAGGLSYSGPAHGISISVENPLVVLDGNSGLVYSSGLGQGSIGADPTPYDRSTPLLSLNLSSATVVLRPDGSRVIGPAVPAIASAGMFPANYPVGSGPERTPNTFGSFTLTLRTDAVAGPAGPQGAPGPAGATGPAGPAGKSGSTHYVVRLAKAPFRGNGTKRVRLSRPGLKRVLATGTLRSRVLRVTLTPAAKKLSGRYRVLAVGTRPARTETVNIPG